MASRKKKIPDDCMPMCSACNAYVKPKNSETGDCRLNPKLAVYNDGVLSWVYAQHKPDDWCKAFERAVQ
jgi:hypothetical protein